MNGQVAMLYDFITAITLATYWGKYSGLPKWRRAIKDYQEISCLFLYKRVGLVSRSSIARRSPL